ncbi:helix-turn-helix transcriptional regulator [Haloarchaeobius sp. DFWS5]|uniref:helix-turn-helix transcriptional regulator n=1 Tax=Haloarchaeobius sp. DFWS5 TaxID=3446114 RepID=UPI003EB6C5A0
MSHDDVEFLARSPNRAAVLCELTTGPYTRAELRDRIGASRVTVGRITTDLEARGWVEQHGTGYRTTISGEAIATAYEEFVTVTDTTHRLEPLLEFLPTDSFDFGLAALADADVVTPTPTEPGRHLSRLRDHFKSANEVTMVVHAMEPEIVASNYETAKSRDFRNRGVLTPAVVEAIRSNPTVCEQVFEMVEADELEFYERQTVPFQLGIFDETTILSADDERGVPRGIVETESAVVRAWARDAFDRLRTDATVVSAARFRDGLVD